MPKGQSARVAVVGCGFYAQNHLHAWSALRDHGAELAAVCDLNHDRAKAAGEECNELAVQRRPRLRHAWGHSIKLRLRQPVKERRCLRFPRYQSLHRGSPVRCIGGTVSSVAMSTLNDFKEEAVTVGPAV